MKNPEHHASNPLERMRGESGKRAKGTEESAIARRRALLRAVVSAPVVLGVSPAGAVAAQGSAYRAAMNDAAAMNDPMLAPLGISDDSGDTWIRRAVPFGTLTVTPAAEGSNQFIYEGVYKIGSTYYLQPADLTAAADPIPWNPGDELVFVEDSTSPKWVLVLFDNSSEDFPEAGLWPEVAANGTNNLQGLHCSSWSSLGIPGRDYSCTPNVSAV